MKKLILTEKPSVAFDFAKALGRAVRSDSSFENDDYVITWAYGHLLELYTPEDYDPKWKTWRLDNLPILPAQIQYRPIERNKKHLQLLLKNLKRKDIAEIIVATDAGREGELIARLILQHAHISRKPIYRFWTGLALTPQVIHQTLQNLKPWKEFDHLFHAGQMRQISDWIVGMNLSRAATLKLGDLYSVGRVQTAVLSFLVDRRIERENFKPEPFWQLQVQFHNDKGRWKGWWYHPQQKENSFRIPKLEDAQKIFDRIKEGDHGQVADVKVTPKTTPPPQLYSLTELQREANLSLQFTAQQTLTVAQTLYEKWKCLSYPRTSSRVLGKENFSFVEKLLGDLRRHSQYSSYFQGVDDQLVNANYTRVFDDTKLTDHHALIPLAPLPNSASLDEKRIYELVLKRFAAVFHPPSVSQMTDVITIMNQDYFKSRGTVILKPGWTQLYKNDDSHEILPPLVAKDPAQVEKKEILAKTTTPPSEYTEGSLLSDMENPARKMTEDHLKSILRGERGLGTESTRAQIIETLLDRKYVDREKRLLRATDKGVTLIQFMRQFPVSKALCTPEETARWEQKLQNISQGQGQPEIFYQEMVQFIEKSLQEFQAGPTTYPNSIKKEKEREREKPLEKNPLGRCPVCGNQVFEEKFYYECLGRKDRKCLFSFSKIIAGKAITPPMAKRLLQAGLTPLIKGFKSKQGNLFNARLKLMPVAEEEALGSGFKSDQKIQVKFVFEPFDKSAGAKNPRSSGHTGGGGTKNYQSYQSRSGSSRSKNSVGTNRVATGAFKKKSRKTSLSSSPSNQVP